MVCRALFGRASSSHILSARALAFRTTLSTRIMPAILQVFSLQHIYDIIGYGQGIVARIMATRAYAWARPIVVESAVVVVEQARAMAVEHAARCVSISSHFGILMPFFRSNVMFISFTDEARAAFLQTDHARLRVVLVGAAVAFGEVLLLNLAVHWLGRAVSLSLPLCSKYSLTAM